MGVKTTKKMMERMILDIIIPRMCEKPNHNTAIGLKKVGMLMVMMSKRVAIRLKIGNLKKKLPISRQINVMAIPVSEACLLLIFLIKVIP